MNTKQVHRSRRGFTLMELLVAMVITTIIVAVLVSITGTAIDTWNRGRMELRAARQAKAMVDIMATDFESFVSRNYKDSEWLSAEFDTDTGGENANASYLVFYTAATDRYDGKVGVDGSDLGGDVSCVGYRLKWKDPIGTGSADDFGTFVLNRVLIDPRETFDELLTQNGGGGTLSNVFSTKFGSDLIEDRNFLCENIYQFTVTFQIEAYDQDVDPPQLYTVPVSVGNEATMTKNFRVLGQGLEMDDVSNVSALDDTELEAGRLSAIEVSITVMSDGAINLLRRDSSKADDADWISKNTFNYSKLVQLPKM